MRLIATLCCSLAVVAGVAADPRPQPEPVQTTTIAGTVPALEGRWLLLTTLGAAGRRSTASVWEIVGKHGAVVLRERFVNLPKAERAGWRPTQEELQEMTAGWETLPPDPRHLSGIEHEIIGRDAFDAAMTQDPMSANAPWIVRQNLAFAPAGPRPLKEVRIVAPSEEEPAGYRGQYVTITLAAAPLPIPIRLQGTFQLIRVPPEPSFWQRVRALARGFWY